MALQLGASLARSRRLRGALLTVVAVQLIVVLGLVVVPLSTLGVGIAGNAAARAAQGTNDASTCAVGTEDLSGGTVPTIGSLNDRQVRVARAIWLASIAVGKQQKWSTETAERAAVVALSAAAQESSLGAAATYQTPNGDGDAGYFQQRTKPGWYGTVAEVNNAAYATRIFLLGKKLTAADVAAARAAGSAPAGGAGYTIPGLVQVKGWEDLSVTQAAQAVQRSAYSDAYARWEQLARTLVRVLDAKVDPDSPEATTISAGVLCGGAAGAMDCPATTFPAEAGLLPDSLRVLRCEHQQFPAITTFGGVGDRPGNVDDDHQTGRAVDAMIPDYQSDEGKALGTEVAEWAVANQQALGVKYVIWNSRIWSVARQQEGWRDCSSGSCYSGPDDTAAHRDHVHVSTYGNSAGAAATGPVTLPIPSGYTLTAGFGQCSAGVWVACHTGQDFAIAAGTPIHAAMAGTVVSVTHTGPYGNLTKIDHGNGVQSWYAHQSSQAVAVGDTVTSGQVIGAVGFTGNVRPAGPAGAHLHFEIRLNGTAVDPLKWLQSKGVL